ncbi:MAG: hypothetical protein ABEJ95_03945 [Candidatus Nanohalobium sp.]
MDVPKAVMWIAIVVFTVFIGLAVFTTASEGFKSNTSSGGEKWNSIFDCVAEQNSLNQSECQVKFCVEDGGSEKECKGEVYGGS